MGHYKVTLSEQERADVKAIAGKGTHAASKVINALTLLNCDPSGERTERRVELELIDSVWHETVRRTLKKTISSRGGKSAV